VGSLVAALADAGQITGKPEVIGSSTGLVPPNALVFTDSLSLAWLVVIGNGSAAYFRGPFRPGLRGSLRRLFWRGGGPIGEGDGAAAANHGGEHVVEAFVIFRAVIQFKLRAKTEIQFVDGFDAANQAFPR
jgi:hypothetical protein